MTGQQRCGSWTMTRSILPRGEHDQACPFTRLRAHTDGAVLQARSTPEHSAGGARCTALTVDQQLEQQVFMYTVTTGCQQGLSSPGAQRISTTSLRSSLKRTSSLNRTRLRRPCPRGDEEPQEQ